MSCPNCAHVSTAADRFCSRCGTRLRPAELETPGENRLVTVLFADMSRFLQTTAGLPAEDAATLVNRLLEAMVAVVQRYSGRVDRLLGDGVLAVFGAPRAHEDDPERAIRAAIEIREAAGELDLEVTCGVNTGEVYFGMMGSEGHQELTVMGEVVNFASRLQGHAAPGQILVGEGTRRLTRRAFGFAPLSIEVRGLEGPIGVYALAGELPRPEKVRGIEGLQAELVGRGAELASLQAARERLLQGEGQVVTLTGEAGIGKSRLIAELKAAVGSRQSAVGSPDGGRAESCADVPSRLPTADCRLPTVLWIEGRCLELSAAASYAPFLDLLRGYFAWRADEAEAARTERFLGALRELVDRGDLPEAQMAEVALLLSRVLSLRLGWEQEASLEHARPDQLKQRTFHAFRDFLQALSQRQPLILVLEDLHWADSLSLDLISFLMESVSRAPILLLCDYRPEREHPCCRLGTLASRQCPERYTGLTLRQLSPAESRQLLDSLLRTPGLPQAAKAAILEKSTGNPFFLEEVVRSLIERGMLFWEDGVWRSRPGIETLTVPESVQTLISSRVDRLDAEVKQALQSAAVIGRLFPRRLLAEVAPASIDLEAALVELAARALVYPHATLPEEEYSFQHALTQETVYHSILRRQRASLHGKVAAAMERLYTGSLEPHFEALAHHYRESGCAEKALEYLTLAGEKAKRRFANETAIDYFRQALTLLGEMPESPERRRRELTLQIGLGGPLIALKGAGSPEVGQVYGRASALCAEEGEIQQLAPVLWGQWLSCFIHAEHLRARELAEQLLALARRGRSDALLVVAYRALGGTLLWLGELGPARAHLEAGLALYKPEKQRALTALYGHDAGVFCLAYLSHTLWPLGYAEQARRRSEEAVALAREVSQPFSLAMVLSVAAIVHRYRGEVAAAQAKAEELIEIASAEGFPFWSAIGSVLRGWALQQQGEGEAGLAQVQEGVAAWRSTGAANAEAYLLSVLAEAHAQRGEAERGLELLTEALAAIEKSAERWDEAEVYRLRGELLSTPCERPSQTAAVEAEAQRCFRRAIEIARAQGAKSWELRAGISLSRLLERQGKAQEAREVLAGIYRGFDEGFDTVDLTAARALLDRLEGR